MSELSRCGPTISGELGPETEVLDELRQRVAPPEASITGRTTVHGQQVHGRRAVLRQSWRG